MSKHLYAQPPRSILVFLRYSYITFLQKESAPRARASPLPERVDPVLPKWPVSSFFNVISWVNRLLILLTTIHCNVSPLSLDGLPCLQSCIPLLTVCYYHDHFFQLFKTCYQLSLCLLWLWFSFKFICSCRPSIFFIHIPRFIMHWPWLPFIWNFRHCSWLKPDSMKVHRPNTYLGLEGADLWDWRHWI